MACLFGPNCILALKPRGCKYPNAQAFGCQILYLSWFFVASYHEEPGTWTLRDTAYCPKYSELSAFWATPKKNWLAVKEVRLAGSFGKCPYCGKCTLKPVTTTQLLGPSHKRPQHKPSCQVVVESDLLEQVAHAVC